MQIRIQDIVFIFNPNSGRRKSIDLIEELLAINPDADYFISNSLQEFDEFFKSEVDRYKVVVICGGDGTINTALKYLKDRDLTLAVLPNGSGNGFARELGFKNNIEFLIDKIIRGNTILVDLIQVNEDYSCNVTGLGIDSYVTTEFDKSRNRGLKGYIYNSVRSFFKYKPIEAELTVSRTTVTGTYLMICIANTRQFGSGAFIAPAAKYNDGLLEVALIRPIPFYRLPSLVYRLFSKSLTNSKYVEYMQTPEIHIKSNSGSYHVDGEPKEMKSSLDISIAGQVKVIDMYN